MLGQQWEQEKDKASVGNRAQGLWSVRIKKAGGGGDRQMGELKCPLKSYIWAGYQVPKFQSRDSGGSAMAVTRTGYMYHSFNVAIILK